MKRSRFQPPKSTRTHHETAINKLPTVPGQPTRQAVPVRTRISHSPVQARPTSAKQKPAKRSPSATRDTYVAKKTTSWEDGPMERAARPSLLADMRESKGQAPAPATFAGPLGTATPDGWAVYMDSLDLAATTKQTYYRIGTRILKANISPLDWLRRKFAGERVAPGTYSSYSTGARHFRRYLVEAGAHPGKIGGEVVIPSRAIVQKSADRYERAPLSIAEYAQFRQAIADAPMSAQFKAILLLMPWTGLRPAEILKVQVNHIVKRGQIFGIEVQKGKRSKDRWVPLVKDARTILQAYMETKSHGRKYLFPRNAQTDRPMSNQALSQAVRTHLRPRLGSWAEELKAHQLRHTYATNLLRAGVDLASIQILMGHADINTTKRYLHPDDKMLENSVQKMEAMLRGDAES